MLSLRKITVLYKFHYQIFVLW